MFYIYRLTDGNQDYYGQTVDCKKRLRIHKCPSQKCMSRLLNKDNMEIHVIHTLYTKQEADETEEFYILNMECVNTKVPSRTDKEWYQDNKEVILGKQKKYKKANKETKCEYHKEYYQTNKEKINQKVNCECGGKYTTANKSTHLKSKKHKNYING